MKKINFLICTSLFLILTSASYSQNTVKEEIVIPASKKLGVRGAEGIKTLYSGAGSSGSEMTPIFEIGDLKEDGFLIRNKFTFTKYSNDLKKVWETEIEKKYALGDFPNGEIISNGTNSYFYESHSSFNKAMITKFDATGKALQYEFLNKKRFTDKLFEFVDEKGFNFIAFKADLKLDKISYFIITFNKTTLAESVTEIDLPTSEFEIKNYSVENPFNFLWYPYQDENGRMIFIKNYIKSIENSKEKEIVVSTAEYKQGQKTIPIVYKFANTNVVSAKYVRPSVTIDFKNNSLYMTGLLSSKATNLMDALYYYRYDLQKGNNTFTKEIPLTEINSKMGWNEKFKDKVGEVSFLTYAQSLSLDVVFEKENNLLSINMDGGSKGLSRGKVWLYGILLDEKGAIVKLEEFFYSPNPYALYPFIISPKGYTKLFIDKNVSLKNTAYDFIFNQGEKSDPQKTMWSVFPREKYSLLLNVNDETSEIKAYKIIK